MWYFFVVATLTVAFDMKVRRLFLDGRLPVRQFRTTRIGLYALIVGISYFLLDTDWWIAVCITYLFAGFEALLQALPFGEADGPARKS